MRNLLLFCTLLLCAPSLFATTDDVNPQFAEGYILIKPKAGVSDVKLAAMLARFSGASISFDKKLEKLNIATVKVPRGSELDFAQSLREQPEVKFAELDYFLVPAESVPSDPGYVHQWHLPTIGSPAAWVDSTGSGVIVAVIDTGVDGNHPDLQRSVLPGRNIVAGNDNTGDVMGHGTSIAGTVAAAGNNAIGVASVAYGAQILPVRISERMDGRAYFSDMAAGIIWAAENGARVANLSYGAGGSETVQSAAKFMRNSGGLVFVSAGNEGTDPQWPNLEDLIVVAATDRSDAVASFSNYGAFIDIAAPGDFIYTTTAGGGYAAFNGTSFASPIAAGVAALIIAHRPKLDPGQVVEIMRATATDSGEPGWDPAYGAGRVDAQASLKEADFTRAADSTDPVAILLGPSNGDTVTGFVPISVVTEDSHTVLGVDLYVDNAPIATDFAPPYEFLFDTDRYAGGVHSISAKARDSSGNVGQSGFTSVMIGHVDLDRAGPQITITQPLNHSAVTGLVEVSAYATDKNGVSSIRVAAEGRLLCAGAPNTTCDWDTRNLGTDEYVITAKATDKHGNTSIASITVTVGKPGSEAGKRLAAK